MARPNTVPNSSIKRLISAPRSLDNDSMAFFCPNAAAPNAVPYCHPLHRYWLLGLAAVIQMPFVHDLQRQPMQSHIHHPPHRYRLSGSDPTASGVYPSALDVLQLHSEGSRVGPFLLDLLTTAINEQNGPPNQQAPNIDPVSRAIFRPPFPMPCTRPCSVLYASHHKGTLPSSSFNTLSTQFRAGSNITPGQADVRCHEFDEEVLCRSLAALVGLQDITQGKHQWIRNGGRYFRVPPAILTLVLPMLQPVLHGGTLMNLPWTPVLSPSNEIGGTNTYRFWMNKDPRQWR